jgi:hypothetical protein
MRTGRLETQLSMDAALERAEDWAGKAEAAIRWMEKGWRFSADDVRALVGHPPGHGDAFGGVFRNARRAGLIRAIGYTTSSRPKAHGRVLREWERL